MFASRCSVASCIIKLPGRVYLAMIRPFDRLVVRAMLGHVAAAQAEGRSPLFVDPISRVLWDGTVKGWNEGDHLACAAAAAGFDLAAMDAAVTADPDRYEAIIAVNEKEHAASGHWGVPTFVFEHEPFFGQDRIGLLIWRMQARGLTRRS
jgi:2-hydroxychromene-2-carboxylate isomerase